MVELVILSRTEVPGFTYHVIISGISGINNLEAF